MRRSTTLILLVTLLAAAALTAAPAPDRPRATSPRLRGEGPTPRARRRPDPPKLTQRIKDIVDVRGVRGNPLVGYGVVTGLNGTGDDSPASRRAVASALRRLGIVLDAKDVSSKNIASVMVTAELGPFAHRGTELNVTVSSIGDAKSLHGGTLLMTPLIAADGETYAVAQGEVIVGGFAASGEASSITKNHPTVGRIPGGATVEREEIADFVEGGRVTLLLRHADFATAGRIADAINDAWPRSAVAVDASQIAVDVPRDLSPAELVAFVGRIGALKVEVDQPAVVVINERTGTIVVGGNVSVSLVGISHGNLAIITKEQDFVSQPLPFSDTGTTEKMQRTEIDAVEDGGAMHVMGPQVSVAELARALNAMGLTPRDLVSIFMALQDQGALQGRVEAR